MYMNGQGDGLSSGICGRMYGRMIGGDCFGVKNTLRHLGGASIGQWTQYITIKKYFKTFRGSQHRSVNTTHNDSS